MVLIFDVVNRKTCLLRYENYVDTEISAELLVSCSAWLKLVDSGISSSDAG